MSNTRRDFLKQLGLGSLVVAAGVSPIIASAVDKGIELDFDNPEQLLNQKITVFRYKKGNILSNAFKSKNEAELFSLIDVENEDYWWTKENGGVIAMELNNFAFNLAEKFDVKSWEAEKVAPYIKSLIPKIIEDKITLKEYLQEIEDKMNGYII